MVRMSMSCLALALCASSALAQPPWKPWKIENLNLVSGEVQLHSPNVWVAGTDVPSIEACQALCEKNATCNAFDYAASFAPDAVGACDENLGNWDTCDGTASCPYQRTCYFRNDHFWSPKPNGACNHTCGIRVTPEKKPPAPPAPPLPPLPPPPAVKPPSWVPTQHRTSPLNIYLFRPAVFILTDDQDRILGEEDYTELGSLQVMKNVQAELIEKGAFFEHFHVNTPICCPSRTEFFSGRYYHNIGPPNDVGACMHVDTHNAVHPLTSMFGLLKRAGYDVGAFGKITNDAGVVLKLASEWNTMTYIDSPVNYNSYMGTSYWRYFPNGSYYTENIDSEAPEFGTPYQTTQIGNRTLRWLDEKLKAQKEVEAAGGVAKPFFDYIGPHAPHYPAQPAPWYEKEFPDVTIPITPNYNLSSPDKAQHVRQNPAFTELAHCWENQHFRDRWRTLLSVDEVVGAVVDKLTEAGVIDKTFIFYSSDHGYKQGQWRVGTSKQHPYETDIRVPFLARGPGIQAGSKPLQVTGNIDLTPTMLELAGGASYVPEFMDGHSMVPFLVKTGEVPDREVRVSGWREAMLNEYLSVGTYYNDHSSAWDDGSTLASCGGKMPRGINGTEGSCVEEEGVAAGQCYFVDSTHSNSWRAHRTVSATENTLYVEYDPTWGWNTTVLQHYELYDLNTDFYQMKNIYSSAPAERKKELHEKIVQHFACGAPVLGSIQNNIMPSGKSNCP